MLESKSEPRRLSAMTSHRGMSLNGATSQISRECGMESVIQKMLIFNPSAPSLVKFFQDPWGNTACVTYMLMPVAPALLSACSTEHNKSRIVGQSMDLIVPQYWRSEEGVCLS